MGTLWILRALFGVVFGLLLWAIPASVHAATDPNNTLFKYLEQGRVAFMFFDDNKQVDITSVAGPASLIQTSPATKIENDHLGNSSILNPSRKNNYVTWVSLDATKKQYLITFKYPSASGTESISATLDAQTVAMSNDVTLQDAFKIIRHTNIPLGKGRYTVDVGQISQNGSGWDMLRKASFILDPEGGPKPPNTILGTYVSPDRLIDFHFYVKNFKDKKPISGATIVIRSMSHGQVLKAGPSQADAIPLVMENNSIGSSNNMPVSGRVGPTNSSGYRKVWLTFAPGPRYNFVLESKGYTACSIANNDYDLTGPQKNRVIEVMMNPSAKASDQVYKPGNSLDRCPSAKKQDGTNLNTDEAFNNAPTEVTDAGKLAPTTDGCPPIEIGSGIIGSTFRWIYCRTVRFMGDLITSSITGIQGFVSQDQDNNLSWQNIPKNLTKGQGTPENAWIVTGWEITLGLGSSFVGFLLIIAVFANILRIDLENWGVRKLLPSIILNTFMASISLLIIRFLVDVANVLTKGLDSMFAKAVGGPNPLNLGGGLMNVFGIINQGTVQQSCPGQSELGLVTGIVTRAATGLFAGVTDFILVLFTLVLFIAIFIGLLWIAIQLYLRAAIIYVLVVTAPLAYISGAFPFFKSFKQKWSSNLMSWIFMAPAVFFVLELASLPGRILANQSTSVGCYNVSTNMNFVAAGAGVILLYYAARIPSIMGGAVAGTYTKFVKSGADYSAKAAAGNRWADQDKAMGVKTFRGQVGAVLNYMALPYANVRALKMTAGKQAEFISKDAERATKQRFGKSPMVRRLSNKRALMAFARERTEEDEKKVESIQELYNDYFNNSAYSKEAANWTRKANPANQVDTRTFKVLTPGDIALMTPDEQARFVKNDSTTQRMLRLYSLFGENDEFRRAFAVNNRIAPDHLESGVVSIRKAVPIARNEFRTGMPGPNPNDKTIQNILSLFAATSANDPLDPSASPAARMPGAPEFPRGYTGRRRTNGQNESPPQDTNQSQTAQTTASQGSPTAPQTPLQPKIDTEEMRSEAQAKPPVRQNPPDDSDDNGDVPPAMPTPPPPPAPTSPGAAGAEVPANNTAQPVPVSPTATSTNPNSVTVNANNARIAAQNVSFGAAKPGSPGQAAQAAAKAAPTLTGLTEPQIAETQATSTAPETGNTEAPRPKETAAETQGPQSEVSPAKTEAPPPNQALSTPPSNPELIKLHPRYQAMEQYQESLTKIENQIAEIDRQLASDTLDEPQIANLKAQKERQLAIRNETLGQIALTKEVVGAETEASLAKKVADSAEGLYKEISNIVGFNEADRRKAAKSKDPEFDEYFERMHRDDPRRIAERQEQLAKIAKALFGISETEAGKMAGDEKGFRKAFAAAQKAGKYSQSSIIPQPTPQVTASPTTKPETMPTLRTTLPAEAAPTESVSTPEASQSVAPATAPEVNVEVGAPQVEVEMPDEMAAFAEMMANESAEEMETTGEEPEEGEEEEETEEETPAETDKQQAAEIPSRDSSGQPQAVPQNDERRLGRQAEPNFRIPNVMERRMLVRAFMANPVAREYYMSMRRNRMWGYFQGIQQRKENANLRSIFGSLQTDPAVTSSPTGLSDIAGLEEAFGRFQATGQTMAKAALTASQLKPALTQAGINIGNLNLTSPSGVVQLKQTVSAQPESPQKPVMLNQVNQLSQYLSTAQQNYRQVVEENLAPVFAQSMNSEVKTRFNASGPTYVNQLPAAQFRGVLSERLKNLGTSPSTPETKDETVFLTELVNASQKTEADALAAGQNTPVTANEVIKHYTTETVAKTVADLGAQAEAQKEMPKDISKGSRNVSNLETNGIPRAFGTRNDENNNFASTGSGTLPPLRNIDVKPTISTATPTVLPPSTPFEPKPMPTSGVLSTPTANREDEASQLNELANNTATLAEDEYGKITEAVAGAIPETTTNTTKVILPATTTLTPKTTTQGSKTRTPTPPPAPSAPTQTQALPPTPSSPAQSRDSSSPAAPRNMNHAATQQNHISSPTPQARYDEIGNETAEALGRIEKEVKASVAPEAQPGTFGRSAAANPYGASTAIPLASSPTFGAAPPLNTTPGTGAGAGQITLPPNINTGEGAPTSASPEGPVASPFSAQAVAASQTEPAAPATPPPSVPEAPAPPEAPTPQASAGGE